MMTNGNAKDTTDIGIVSREIASRLKTHQRTLSVTAFKPQA